MRTASIITLMMEGVRTSKTSFYSGATLRYISEGSHLQPHSLKCHLNPFNFEVPALIQAGVQEESARISLDSQLFFL
jgi:hypothetical protein